ncbi:hypothetical protein TQ33_1153 [Kangiella geojedonensis]|uniref:Uncharacterized protein n=2 Tax=Kangiella geojedonensis TaxID=914150 RepID=A0A0F6RC49_9GAMM|nr:hypothetical protein TQ33_1153 [Kangiella geojedonensis]
MSRLIYKIRSFETATNAYCYLLKHGLRPDCLHIVSKMQSKFLRRGVNTANFWYKTNIIKGSLLGAFIGLLLSVLIYIVFTESNFIKREFVSMLSIIATLISIGFCTWLGGLLGLESKNSSLSKYEQYIKDGEHLLLVDLKTNECVETLKLFSKQFHDAQLLDHLADELIPFDFMRTVH